MWHIICLSLIILFSLSGCAHNSANIGASNDNQEQEKRIKGPDPDGDGDNKGYGFFSEVIPATGNRVFIFDPNYNAWAVYDAQGNLVNTGRASGGKLYCPDVGRACKTIVGSFRVTSKKGADCISSKFPLETNGGAPMPYCMFFGYKGYAIHGSNYVPDHNASHGCIRVTPTAAKWLNEEFISIGTRVLVLPYE